MALVRIRTFVTRNPIGSVVIIGCLAGPNEKRLLINLLHSYNTLERPVSNESEPVIVTFGLTLQQIIDVVSLPLFLNVIYSSNNLFS